QGSVDINAYVGVGLHGPDGPANIKGKAWILTGFRVASPGRDDLDPDLPRRMQPSVLLGDDKVRLHGQRVQSRRLPRLERGNMDERKWVVSQENARLI